MRPFLVPLVAVLSLLDPSPAISQRAPAGVQGGVQVPGAPAPGSAVPGMPPRDNSSATPQAGAARIRGRVVAAETGQPLRRAQVTLTMEASQPPLRRATTTDVDGYYQFRELPAGRFTLSVMKAGYVTLQYGQRRPFEAGTPVTIADGEMVDRVDVVLPRGGVIAVRVTDEFGEPVAGVSIQVQRFTYGQDGQRRLASAGGAATSLSGTDDRGEFRAYGLMPGEYVVQGTMRLGATAVGTGSDSSEGFAPTFYPGTIDAVEAQPISLAVGQELSIQFPMVAARFQRVTGTVMDSEGRPASGASLSLVTFTDSSMSSRSAGQTAPDGTFVISGVPPGEQNLRATLTRAGGLSESASVPIVVGVADIEGLPITTGTGARVTGRVVFDGTSSTGTPASRRVTATQADPMQRMAGIGAPSDPLANGTLDADGNFTIAGVMGTVFFGMPAQPGWILKSVTLDGQDITDLPLDMTGRTSLSGLELVLTDKLTTISGQVTDGRGDAVRDYVVVIQAAEAKEPIVASRWIRVVRPDTSGRFETRGMRPGRYVATALDGLEQGREFSPAFQRELRRVAREFTVGEGESVTIDLRLTPDL